MTEFGCLLRWHGWLFGTDLLFFFDEFVFFLFLFFLFSTFNLFILGLELLIILVKEIL